MTDSLKELKNIFGELQFSQAPEQLAVYGKDWTNYFEIKAQAVVFPKSIEQVQKLVSWATKWKTPLVPSGGRTGLSGGACALSNEVVVSFEKMNQILDYNPVDQVVTVEPGITTEELQKFATNKGLFYPVDFAAKGSSQIGGNIATNAGGIKVVKYGMTRNWISGLKLVTGTGELLDLNRSLVKNATGYDLKDLVIGSEGTLGFVVEAQVKLTQAPKASKTLLMAVPDSDSLMRCFENFQRQCSFLAFEFFSEKALQKVMAQTQAPRPLQQTSPFYVITEIEMNSDSDEDTCLQIFERGLEEAWLLDGIVGQSQQQDQQLWKYRENISESLSPFTPYKNDISTRISRVTQLMHEVDGVLSKEYPHFEVIWFGHIGDGNLHINILKPKDLNKADFLKECRRVDEILFSSIQKLNGSISAEHGVGLTKKPFLHFSRSPAEIAIMKSIKTVFDPHNLINPGKIL